MNNDKDIKALVEAAWKHTEAFPVMEDSGQVAARKELEKALAAFD